MAVCSADRTAPEFTHPVLLAVSPAPAFIVRVLAIFANQRGVAPEYGGVDHVAHSLFGPRAAVAELLRDVPVYPGGVFGAFDEVGARDNCWAVVRSHVSALESISNPGQPVT
jgi:hypothetical protein